MAVRDRQRSDGHRCGKQALHHGHAQLSHGEHHSVIAREGGVLRHEAVGDVHAVVYDKADGHDEVDRRDRVQVQAGDGDGSHQVHEHHHQHAHYDQHGFGMSQHEQRDDEHGQEAPGNGLEQLALDDLVLMVEDVALRVHEDARELVVLPLVPPLHYPQGIGFIARSGEHALPRLHARILHSVASPGHFRVEAAAEVAVGKPALQCDMEGVASQELPPIDCVELVSGQSGIVALVRHGPRGELAVPALDGAGDRLQLENLVLGTAHRLLHLGVALVDASDVQIDRDAEAEGRAPEVPLLGLQEVAEVALVRGEIQHVELEGRPRNGHPRAEGGEGQEDDDDGKLHRDVAGDGLGILDHQPLQAGRLFGLLLRRANLDADEAVQPTRCLALGVQREQRAKRGDVKGVYEEHREHGVDAEAGDGREGAAGADRERQHACEGRQRDGHALVVHCLTNALLHRLCFVCAVEGICDDERVVDTDANHDEGQDHLQGCEREPEGAGDPIARRGGNQHQHEVTSAQHAAPAHPAKRVTQHRRASQQQEDETHSEQGGVAAHRARKFFANASLAGEHLHVDVLELPVDAFEVGGVQLQHCDLPLFGRLRVKSPAKHEVEPPHRRRIHHGAVRVRRQLSVDVRPHHWVALWVRLAGEDRKQVSLRRDFGVEGGLVRAEEAQGPTHQALSVRQAGAKVLEFLAIRPDLVDLVHDGERLLEGCHRQRVLAALFRLDHEAGDRQASPEVFLHPVAVQEGVALLVRPQRSGVRQQLETHEASATGEGDGKADREGGPWAPGAGISQVAEGLAHPAAQTRRQHEPPLKNASENDAHPVKEEKAEVTIGATVRLAKLT
mmetsp:Transcript_118507/g.335188  ORF Transcript_118507/g.335188 Transcript_118507/m.335188 type:complete len:843 (-) Transcript_118507:23-2551(-)